MLKHKVRDFVADKQIRARRFYNNIKHHASIDPLKIYYVDPEKIDESMEVFKVPSWHVIFGSHKQNIPFSVSKRRIAGTVRGGSWDKQTRPFHKSEGTYHFHVYESFNKRFEKNFDWEDTKFYKKVLSEIDEGRVWWGCKSESDVRQRCAKLDRIYKNIEENGYKTQKEIINSNKEEHSGKSRKEVYRKIDGEVAICIGRKGELIYYDGRNRLAIAKVLGLNKIPVVILVRHKQWQQLRNRVARGEICLVDLPERLQGHPDLIELE